MAPQGGTMVGMSRSFTPEGKVFFEFMRIEVRGDAVVLIPSPKGQEATPFTYVAGEGGGLHFVNENNDFPKWIRYRLAAPGVLEAAIGVGPADGDKVMRWRWQRLPGPVPWGASPKAPPQP